MKNQMKIDQIRAKNYKGFRDIELQFSPELNVFVGINGSGKTSLLELIAMFLNQFANILSGNNLSSPIDYKLSQLDINLDASETKNQISIKAPWVFPHHDVSGEGAHLNWNINLGFNSSKNTLVPLKKYCQAYQDFLSKGHETAIPVLRYYQSHKMTDEKTKKTNPLKRYLVPQLKAYNAAFSPRMDFGDFIDWFVEEENKENREKVSKKDLTYVNPNLCVIRNAIAKFFASFPSASFKNLRVEERDLNLKTTIKSSLVMDKDNKTYNLKQLSDGEKIVVLMVSDIAYRLSVANPESKDPLGDSGIVLIDEIDLHLHPAWQRYIIPCLLSTFPKLQFFITTHSPQVLSMVNDKNIFIIEDFQIVKHVPKTNGKDSNTILWDVFSVKERPENAMADFETLYQLMENADENYKKAFVKLNELSEKYGETDHEIVRARLQLDYLTQGK